MPFHLVVKSPFYGPLGYYPVGHEITDPAEVARVLASHHEAHVVKRAAPDAPPMAAEAAPEAAKPASNADAAAASPSFARASRG